MERIEEISKLKEIAKNIRLSILKTTHTAGCGHTGGSLSETEILTALFFNVMNIDPAFPKNPDRDRFILSKGHATPGYYSALAERGFFPKSTLDGFDSLGSILQAHPDMHKVPGCDISSGSLGQGLSCGVGMALGAQKSDKEFCTFVLMGDGESTEGQIWEAVLYAGAPNIQLKGIVAIVDYNKVQLSDKTENIVDIGDLGKKYQAFGWSVIDCDGHNMEQLIVSLNKAKKLAKKGPVAVIAHTVKGKGVSFMEDKCTWHGRAPDAQEYKLAVEEVNR